MYGATCSGFSWVSLTFLDCFLSSSPTLQAHHGAIGWSLFSRQEAVAAGQEVYATSPPWHRVAPFSRLRRRWPLCQRIPSLSGDGMAVTPRTSEKFGNTCCDTVSNSEFRQNVRQMSPNRCETPLRRHCLALLPRARTDTCHI